MVRRCGAVGGDAAYVKLLLPSLLPAALRAAQNCRYLVYSEADFEVFAPQGPHVAPMEVKFGMEEGSPSIPNFTPLLQR